MPLRILRCSYAKGCYKIVTFCFYHTPPIKCNSGESMYILELDQMVAFRQYFVYLDDLCYRKTDDYLEKDMDSMPST